VQLEWQKESCMPPVAAVELMPNVFAAVPCAPDRPSPKPSCLAGFAVLHYKGVNESLPTTKTPQPGSVQPWTFEQEAKIIASSTLLQVNMVSICMILELDHLYGLRCRPWMLVC